MLQFLYLQDFIVTVFYAQFCAASNLLNMLSLHLALCFLTIMLTVPAHVMAQAESCAATLKPIVNSGEGFLKHTTCEGLHYHISIPAKSSCGEFGCGLIFDIHGRTMTGINMAYNDLMAMHGVAAGYIVVHPTAPVRAFGVTSWAPLVDHDKLIRFLRVLRDTAEVDPTMVHVMGFSEGGFATWNILCKASDVVCSAAPLEASTDSWGVGYGSNCFKDNGAGPQKSRSVLYASSPSSLLAMWDNAEKQRENVKRAYGPPIAATTSSGTGFERKHWENGAGVSFDFIKFFNTAELGGYGGGHLIPDAFVPVTDANGYCDSFSCNSLPLVCPLVPPLNTGYKAIGVDSGVSFAAVCGAFNLGLTPFDPCQKSHRVCQGFTWSLEVLEFFKKNKCPREEFPGSVPGALDDDSASSAAHLKWFVILAAVAAAAGLVVV